MPTFVPNKKDEPTFIPAENSGPTFVSHETSTPTFHPIASAPKPSGSEPTFVPAAKPASGPSPFDVHSSTSIVITNGQRPAPSSGPTLVPIPPSEKPTLTFDSLVEAGGRAREFIQSNPMDQLKAAFLGAAKSPVAAQGLPMTLLLKGSEEYSKAANLLADTSHKGLAMFTDKIPDATLSEENMKPVQDAMQMAGKASGITTLNPAAPGLLKAFSPSAATANIALNLGGAVPKVLTELAPEFLRPMALLLGVAAPEAAVLVKESPAFIKMAEKVSSAIPAGIKRVFTYRFGQPKLYKEAAEQAEIEIAQGVDKAVELGNKLHVDLTPGQQLRAGQILRGGISVGQAEKMLNQDAQLARVTIDLLESELKDLGAVPKNALLHFTKRDLAALRNEQAALDLKINRIRSYAAQGRKEALLGEGAKPGFPGQTSMINDLQAKRDQIQKTIADHYRFGDRPYLGRFYQSKELPGDVPAFAGKPNRIDIDRFMKRTDIPEDVRKAMGEILSAGYPTAKSIAQMNMAVVRLKQFRAVAKNAEWSTLNAEEAAIRGFTKMPETKKLGELSGRYVHPEISRDINEITRTRTDWEKIYGSALSKWKFGKTVLGFPATHFRNMIGNTVMMDLGGVDPLEQMRLVPKAAKEILNKGKWYQEAKATGLLGNEYYGGEINELKNSMLEGRGPILERLAKHSEKLASRLESVGGKSAAALDKLGKIYQGEEQAWKLAKFIKNREMGMGIKEAAADAEKYLFNYAKVSPAIKYLRKMPLGAPFITYASKALPIVAETLVTNPMRVWKYEMLFKAMEQTAIDNGTVTPEDLDTIRRNSYGRTVVLPVKDENGDPLKVDLSYLLPWGDIGEAGGWFGLPSVASPSGPLNVLIDLGRNNSTFKAANGADPQIWKDTDLPSEKLQKASDYALKAFLPSITPGIPTDSSFFKGGYTFQKMVNAVQKKPDYFGRVRNPFLALMDAVVGVKIMPADPEMMKSFEMIRKKKQAEEARLETIKVLRNQGVSDSYKAKKVDAYVEKINRIFKK